MADDDVIVITTDPNDTGDTSDTSKDVDDIAFDTDTTVVVNPQE